MSKENKNIKVTWNKEKLEKFTQENYKQGMSREEFDTLFSKEDVSEYVTHSLVE